MTITVYEAASGRVLRRVDGEAPRLAEGEAAYAGALPLFGCRINPANGAPEFFEPPSAGPDLAWNALEHKFEPTAAAVRRAMVVAQIADLEARQARAIREAALDQPGARARLQDIDNQIAQLRKDLQ
jgi:hypothetical protein